MSNVRKDKFSNSLDPDKAAHNEPHHMYLLYTVCPLVFEFSMDETFFEILQMLI